MSWTLESCAAFLRGRRKREKHEVVEQVEQVTAAPGEKRDLPKRAPRGYKSRG